MKDPDRDAIVLRNLWAVTLGVVIALVLLVVIYLFIVRQPPRIDDVVCNGNLIESLGIGPA